MKYNILNTLYVCIGVCVGMKENVSILLTSIELYKYTSKKSIQFCCINNCKTDKIISLKLSLNYEAFASEFQGNLKEMHSE